MRLVEQINEIDCGIAVAAMISGYSYRVAMRADLYPWINSGLSVPQMLDLLSRLTRKKFKEIRKRQKLNSISDLPTGALLIRPQRYTYGHWIASDGQFIYDPELREKISVSDYDRADWTLIRVLTPSGSSAAATCS